MVLLPDTVFRAINSLHNNKAMDIDEIPNECLKYAEDTSVLISVYYYFICGIMPGEWLKDGIKPIYTKKRNPRELESYRSVRPTIVSCFGNLFTSILNKRLNVLRN